MLRTNNKRFLENLKNYIIDNFNYEDYEDMTLTYNDICNIILERFREEYRSEYKIKHHTECQSFISWCAGLPSILDTCYYYNRSAVDDLGNLLEETEEQRNKYTEQQAEEILSRLIYRELNKQEYIYLHTERL